MNFLLHHPSSSHLDDCYVLKSSAQLEQKESCETPQWVPEERSLDAETSTANIKTQSTLTQP